MEYQKIINLLGNTSNQLSKFRTISTDINQMETRMSMVILD